MVRWNPTQALPDQLGDAFAAMYDWLEEAHKSKAENQGWRQQVAKLPPQALIDAIGKSGWKTPIEIQDHVAAANGGGRANIGFAVYQCLRAIDEGVLPFHPTRGNRLGSPNLSINLLTQYRGYGRYNTDPNDGYVLPKFARERYRGTALSEHFTYLVRANPDTGSHVLIHRPGRGQARSQWTGDPKVAIVPFLHDFDDDATFKGIQIKRQPHFRVHHAELEDRVRHAVEAIRSEQVQIAVFPELALDEHLLEVLVKALRATNRVGAALEWVIAGAELPTTDAASIFPSVNAAVVLNSVGQIVDGPASDGRRREWRQLKRHKYKMSVDEQRRYGLRHCFRHQRVCDREEAIEVGNLQVVVEDTRSGGRYAVLICEDWGQEEGTTSIVRQLFCSVVIAIVMDGPMLTHRWAARRAQDIVAQTGAISLLANSLLLPNRPSCREHVLNEEAWDRAKQEERDRVKNGKRGKGGKKATPKDPPAPLEDPYPDGQQPVGLLYTPSDHPGQAPGDPRQLGARSTPKDGDPSSLISESVHLSGKP